MCGNILSFQKPLTQDRIIQIILTSLNTLSMGLFYRWELTLPPNCLKFGIFAKELFQATLGARGFSCAVSGFGQVSKSDPRPTKLLWYPGYFQARVVQKVENVIYGVNRYSVANASDFPNT